MATIIAGITIIITGIMVGTMAIGIGEGTLAGMRSHLRPAIAMRKVAPIAASIALLASSALAQSSFDGTYSGVSRVSGGRPRDLSRTGRITRRPRLPICERCSGAVNDP
jgi:hypothetical protein